MHPQLHRIWHYLLRHPRWLMFSAAFISLLLFPYTSQAAGGFGFGAGVDTIVLAIFVVGPWIGSYITYLFAKISSAIFTYVLSEIIQWTITRDVISGRANTAIFLQAWAIVRDYANMLIVVGLVAVAIATILRFRDYEAKKLLIPLIIVALLVNFSIVFVGGMIDLSNIIMHQFTGRIANTENDIIAKIWDSHTDVETIVKCDFSKAGGYGDDSAGWSRLFQTAVRDALNLSLIAFTYFFVAWAFIYLSLLLIARYAILAFLFVLSPLAFVFRVFPVEASKKLWSEWWHSFIRWCFMGLGLAFTVFLAGEFLQILRFQAAANLVSSAPVPAAAGGGGGGGILGGILGIVAGGIGRSANNGCADTSINFQMTVFLAVIVMILWVGIRITKQSSALGAGAVMGIAQKVGNTIIAGGQAIGFGSLKLAGGAAASGAKLTGAPQAFQAIGNTVRERFADWRARSSEAMGFAPKGSAKLRRQQKFSFAENEKRVSGLSLAEKKSLATTSRITMTDEEKKDRMAAINSMIKDGSFATLSHQAQESAMQFAQTTSPDAIAESEFLKINPDLYRNATKSIEQAKARIVRANPSITPTALQTQAEASVRKDAYVRMPEDKEFSKLNAKDQVERFKQTIDPATGNINAHGAQMLDTMAEKGHLGQLAGEIGGWSTLSKHLNFASTEFGSTVFRSAAKHDPFVNRYNEEKVEEKKATLMGTINPATGAPYIEADARADAKDQLEQEGYDKAKNVLDLSKEALGKLSFLQSTTKKSLSQAIRKLPKDKRDALRKFITPGTTESAELNAKIASLAPGSQERTRLEDIRAMLPGEL